MDQPEHNPSDTLSPPRSLTERLKAEANGHAPAAEDLTASIMALDDGSIPDNSPPLHTPLHMARRFAPDGIPDSRRVEVQAPLAPLVEAPARGAGGMRTLILVLILVALVPSATLGAMVWFHMIATPWTRTEFHDGAPSAIEQALVTATLAPATTLPKQDVQVPVVALTAPDRLEAQAGQEVPFAVTIDGTPPARSIIAISGLPAGATFSDGRPYGETEWTLRPDEIGDLTLTVPSPAAGDTKLAIQLLAPDGRIITSAETVLKVAPDPRAVLVLRPEETTLVADLIAHGNKMVGVGYFPGARAYFQRAAEAGSGEAALLLGETYDPSFIAKMGAQGIKPEPDQAIAWYERAKALGAVGADDKLAPELKVAAKEAAPDSDPPPVAALAADARAAMGTEASADSATSGAAAPTEGGVPELVELTVSANMRESPSSNAPTVRIMEGGTKLRAIGRKGGWVQVTNPETSETGWVYSRYVTAVAAAAGQ